ncbi:MAG: OmpA family protein [Myxococcota bacterium]
MTGSRRSAVVAIAAIWALAGCVTASKVQEDTAELAVFTQEFEEAALICAPRALAEARAHAAFAEYEADEGQTTRAWRHLKTAKQRAKTAWEDSRGEECAPDTDLDGIVDPKDRCPEEPEDYDGDRDEDGCPDLDQDGDGIDDEDDRCPREPEDFDEFEDEDGCPDPDNDQDGIDDDVDQCPMEPEDRDGFEDIDGCPDPDNDQDGIPDTADGCPNQPEDMDGDEDEDGCPDLYEKIVVKKDRIELKQKVFFATARARVLPRSYDLLDEVVDVLQRREDLRVRIEGHTDSRGASRYNKRLSQRRADAVKDYLDKAGVDPTRLVTVGYGEEVPIDTNETREGRARNRRVEFHIIR